MDSGPKCHTITIKFLEENIEENFLDFFLLGKDFLHRTQKQAIQKIRKLDFTKVRNVFSSNDSIKKIKKGKPQTGREYFQSIYLTKSIYPEYIKSSYNLIIKK